MLVVGVDAPDGINADHHDVQVTRAYLDRLPAGVRDHLAYRVTDRLEPVIQHHVIEGLLEPSYGLQARASKKMVLPVRIELTTSALPRMRSTTELRQHCQEVAPLTGRALPCQPEACDG